MGQLWLLLSLTSIAIVARTTTGIICPDTCTCAQESNQYKYSCPQSNKSNETEAQVQIMQTETQSTIYCEDIPNYQTYIPDFDDKELTEYFAFIKCPMLQNYTFADTLAKMGVKNPKKIKFYLGNMANISRSNFANVESINDLTLQSVNIKALPADLLYDLQNLTLITLMDNQIREIPHAFFRESTKLRSIDLGQNHLETLPPYLFENLTDLFMLSLFANKLTTIQPESFYGLDNLRILELLTNKLSSIPTNVFVNLPNLSQLGLRKNLFKSLPENLFENNTKLETLKLDDNMYLTTLPDHFLANLLRLSEVSMTSCNLSTLPENIFWGSDNLKEVNFAYNNLSMIKNTLFRDNLFLRKVNFEHNALTTIEDGTFRRLSKLRQLYLGHNQLRLSTTTFIGLENLEELYLENNNLSDIPKGAFNHFQSLKIIDLCNNALTLHDSNFDTYNSYSIFSHITSLEELHLQNNQINHFYNDWHIVLPKLVKLNLSYNNLTQVSISNFNLLADEEIKINLKNNNIATIDLTAAEAIVLSNFDFDDKKDRRKITVELQNNPINCDCQVYDLIRYVEGSMNLKVKNVFDLRTDDLECQSPNMYQGLKLAQLNSKTLVCVLEGGPRISHKCSDNYFMYRKWDKMLIMNCSYTGLTEVPFINKSHFKGTQFRNMEVNLQGNKLISLPGPNMGYEDVVNMDLSDNEIRDIQWVPPRIQILKLHSNNLTYLDSNELSLINHTTVVNITFHDNPWKCNCDLLNFTKYLQENFKKVSNLHNITCSDSGKELTSLTKTELCPVPTEVIIGLSAMLVVLSLTIGIMAALYYRYQQEIRVWLYAHGWCLYWIKEEELDKDKLYDAFISFSHRDEDFVVNELLPNLEEGPTPFKLCVHFRNWIPGDFITTNIAKSVEDSRRTVVVLSPSFLKSEWGKMEFRTAHIQALSEGRARVIVIIYGEIGPIDELDTELKAYLTTNTYVEWGDPWFWEKLRYALPHPPKFAKPQTVVKVDDKTDLMYEPSTPPIATTPPADSMHHNPLLSKPVTALNVSLIKGTLVNNAEGKNNNIYSDCDIRSIV